MNDAIMIIIMKNCNDFQVHRCTECMRELEAAKDQGSSRMQTSQGRSCFQCEAVVPNLFDAFLPWLIVELFSPPLLHNFNRVAEKPKTSFLR